MSTSSKHENIGGRLPDRIKQYLFDRAEHNGHRSVRTYGAQEIDNALLQSAYLFFG